MKNNNDVDDGVYDWNLLNGTSLIHLILLRTLVDMLLIRREGLGSFVSTCAIQHEVSLWYSPCLAGPEPDSLSNPEHGSGSGSSAGYGAPSSRRSTTRVANWRTGRCTTFTRPRAAWIQASCRSRDPGWHGKPRTTHTQCIRRCSCRRTHRHHATPGQPAAEHTTSVCQPWPRLFRAGTNGRRVLCNTAAVRSCVANGVERRCGATCSEQRSCTGR